MSLRRAAAFAAGMALLLAPFAAALYLLRDDLPREWTVRVEALVGGVAIDHDVRIAMPDGVALAASLYLPRGPRRALPTVLIRLPYDRLYYEEAVRSALWFARHGYAVMVQDVRGKYGSQGEFAPWEHATSDGVATLDWIVAQGWSNGKVGTLGCSALGEMQYSLARARHPAHAAMIATGAGGAWGSAAPNLDQGGFHEGGVLQLAGTFGWSLQHGTRDPRQARAEQVDIPAALQTLPLQDMVSRLQPGPNVFTDYLRMLPGDIGWRRFDLVQAAERVGVPALVINSWGDPTIEGTLELAEKVRRDSAAAGKLARQHVIIPPGNHCDFIGTVASGKFGVLDVANAKRPYGDWYLRWFDRMLRGVGDGLAELPAYQFYVVGEGRWLAASQWPPEHAQVQRWQLGSGGRANSGAGDGTLAPPPPPSASGSATTPARTGATAFDRFVADPMDPVPSRGGPMCCTGNPADRPGPAEQADVEQRQDVLVYTSAPLAQPLRIAGSLRAHLTLSSSAPDIDVVARLVHVWPDGRATSIQEGALRLRYRDGPKRAAPLQPGQKVTVEVPMRSIAYLMPAGHRLRLHVAGSSFPRLERNLNTGGNNYDETQGVVAHNTLHHADGAGSWLELPVLADAHAQDVDAGH
jgi:uncharacterized protein